MKTIGDLFTSAVSPQPLLTFYDDGTGERTELSGVTLGNWVAKTANLLVDGYGLGAGDRATVTLPPHWQSAAVLLGCWSAGVCVGAEAGPPEVSFNTEPAPDEAAGERFLLGLHPFGLPMATTPAGYLDYVAEVRGYGDRYTGAVRPTDPATLTATHAELIDAATARAAELGIVPGTRTLIDVDTRSDPLDWLLAPLAVGASTVLCRHADMAKLDARAAAERAPITIR